MMRNLVLAAACAVAFAVVWALQPIRLDADAARWFAADRGATGVSVMDAVSLFGSVWTLIPGGVVLCACFALRGKAASALWLVLAFGGAIALVYLVKYIVARPRPPLGIRVHEDLEWAFPSGHAVQALAFYATTAALLAGRRALAIAALPIALIGFARVYLGAHWVTDVLGGYALAGAWVALVFALRARTTSGS